MIQRDAFLYLEPKPRDDLKEFAQCGSCRMFVPYGRGQEDGRCVLHGSFVEIDADDSCGLWVDWPTPDGKPNPTAVANHGAELAKGLKPSVTPQESGLVDELVHCRHCKFLVGTGRPACGLYRRLNTALPRLFNLDTEIALDGCCNAWQEREGAEVGRTLGESLYRMRKT